LISPARSNVSFDRLPEKLHSAAVQLERSTAMSRVRTDVDAFVGGRIKQRRKALAMSQSALGEALGVTFQQIQKYERGHNRVGAGALYKMADALDVPISYFFDGLPAPLFLRAFRSINPITRPPSLYVGIGSAEEL
jgi:DNA-binding transcriptional regulator YiaG